MSILAEAMSAQGRRRTITNLPITAANYPGLLEAFTIPQTNITGNDFAGSLGNVSINSSTGWTQPATGQFRRATSGTVTTSGTWPAIGTKSALLIAVGSVAVVGLFAAFGDVTSGPGLRVGGTNSSAILNVLNSAIGISDIDGLTYPIQGKAVQLDQSTASGTVTQYAIDDGASSSADVPVTGDLSTSWGAFSVGAGLAAVTTQASSYLTGAFLFAFTNPVTQVDVYAAMTWMIANPGKIWYGFYHRS